MFKGITKVLWLLVLGIILSPITGFSSLAISGGLAITSLIPKPEGLKMALDVEIWKPWIMEELFKNNEFLNYARNADEYVLVGKVVHIPQAGTASSVKKNRTSLPATIKKRTDVDITYALDEFTSDPRLLTSAEKILSYDKMDSVMGQDMRALKQIVAEWMLYYWRPEVIGNIILTDGSSVATHLSGTTGNRKGFKLENLDEAQARMDEANIPAEGRKAMFSARMFKQLTSLLTAGTYKDFSRAYNEKTGRIEGQLFGFDILQRSTVLRATEATLPVVRDPDATGAVTDNDVVLCWHIDHVERAIGAVDIFETLRSAPHYGDIYSMLVNAGGRKLEKDGRGVIGIIQDNA